MPKDCHTQNPLLNYLILFQSVKHHLPHTSFALLSALSSPSLPNSKENSKNDTVIDFQLLEPSPQHTFFSTDYMVLCHIRSLIIFKYSGLHKDGTNASRGVIQDNPAGKGHLSQLFHVTHHL